MSTNAQGLYRGEEKGRPLGEILHGMARKGRGVHRTQRRRWKQNRYMYRGDQWLQVNVGADQVRVLERDAIRNNSQRRDVVNRLRQFVDARVSLLTAKRPPFEVKPERNDQDHIDAAKQATKIVAGKWDDWRLDERMHELALSAEIDGLAFVSVIYDRNIGPKVSIPVNPMKKQPITDPAEEEGLRRAGMIQYEDARLGEISVRVVRAPQLAIDPFMDSDWAKCRWIVESRLWPRHEVEAMGGKKLKDLAQAASHQTAPATVSMYSDLDEPEQGNVSVDKDAVLVHEAFIKPHGDWPKGAHVVYTAENPGSPLLIEPWDDELPYFPYVPRPDGGNILRARGTVDELRDSQTRFNRNLAQVSEWLDRVARPPLAVPAGALKSDSIYNTKGYFEYHPGFEMPRYLNTPAEPAIMVKDHLPFSIMQMQELSGVTNPSRGVSPGQGVESAVAIDSLIQQTEQTMSATEKGFVRAMEWAVSRCLTLMGRHYIVPRMISVPGVDDREEMISFVGKALKGTHRFKVTGTVLPKSRASQMQTLMQMAPILGPKIIPWLGQIIEGDLDQFFEAEQMERKKQKRENRRIAALMADKKLQLVFEDFTALRDKFMQAASQMGGVDAVAAAGIAPPKLTDMLVQAGVRVPTVDDDDDHAQHLLALRSWTATDAFDDIAPAVRQLAREHREAHVAGMASQMGAMAMQEPGADGPPQGSRPNPRGEASKPKESGAASAAPASPPPTGG